MLFLLNCETEVLENVHNKFHVDAHLASVHV